MWDANTQRAITDSKKVGAKRNRQRLETLNAYLDRQRAALMLVLATLNMARIEIDNTTLKSQLDTVLNRTVKDKPETSLNQPARETFTAYISPKPKSLRFWPYSAKINP